MSRRSHKHVSRESAQHWHGDIFNVMHAIGLGLAKANGGTYKHQVVSAMMAAMPSTACGDAEVKECETNYGSAVQCL